MLCFPIMTLGGRIVIMHHADIGEFLGLIGRYQVTHTFLPPTVIYMLLDHPGLDSAELGSLQCFWYGAAPMSAARLAEAMQRIGPMAQLFGQTEAPMMISTMAPDEHFNADGSIATAAAAVRPGGRRPLVQVGIMDDDGKLLPSGERGEIVVRGSLVMEGYYKNPEATAEASAHGWHHTGDIGYLDDDNYLYIVDRAKDMIITGGFNVYSIEVENALAVASNPSRTAPWSGCRTRNGASGSSPSCSLARAAVSIQKRSSPWSSPGSAASRRRSRSRCGVICRAPRSARSSKRRFAPDWPMTRARSADGATAALAPDPPDISAVTAPD